MGLDLTIGAVILIAGIRGWIKGFVSQAVRIAGFIACVYLANPVREQARPYVLARVPKIDPALMDRILWWVSAVVSYIVLVGLTTLAIQMMRTPPPPGMARSARNDQIAGFLLGAAKGLVIAAFLAAGLQTYGIELVQSATWLQQQTSGSLALKWTDQYQPVPKIWATPAFRRFVNQIQRNGVKGPGQSEGEETPQVAEAEAEPGAEAEPEAGTTIEEIAKAVEDAKAQLQLHGPKAD